MCGICGIIQLNDQSVDESIIRQMMAKIKHRGPNDEGVFINDNFGFGHVRLSIIDLSLAGHQPMFSQDKRFLIIFNGEIYNYIEIRKELNTKYNFRTNTDTEVILASYIEWGTACLDKFNGDWAFVIYDQEEKTFFAARDRFGIKPFYYSLIENKLIFASEIKAIIPFLKNLRPNDKLIYEFLIFNRTDQSDETFFENVFKLQHGHCFTIKNNKFHITKWYNLKDKIKPLILSPDEYRNEIQTAIRLRLRSDVPIGVSLSGGIDSSAITSIVFHDFELKHIKTFSAIYGKEQWADESDFIGEYREILQNMYYTIPTASTFFSDFQNFIHIQGEPVSSIGPYAQYKVMELAKGNVTVTLDGQGADEQLAGYHYFFGAYFNELVSKLSIRMLSKEVYHYFLNHHSFLALNYAAFYSMPLYWKKIISKNVSGNIKNEFARNWRSISTIDHDLYNPRSLNDSLLQHFEYKLEHLLKWDDLNAMNYSIESRVPFLDHNLVEKTLSLPSDLKIRNGVTKYILRESVKDILPQKIYLRTDKKGFSTPANQWFKSHQFQVFIYDLLQSKAFKERGYFNIANCLDKYSKHLEGDIDITKDIWKWINIDVWFKKFIDLNEDTH